MVNPEDDSRTESKHDGYLKRESVKINVCFRWNITDCVMQSTQKIWLHLKCKGKINKTVNKH
jgi:hypothetical protein